jgi:hypothetical protein
VYVWLIGPHFDVLVHEKNDAWRASLSPWRFTKILG